MSNLNNYLKDMTWKPVKKENRVYDFMGNLYHKTYGHIQIYPKCFYVLANGKGKLHETHYFPLNVHTLYIIQAIQMGRNFDKIGKP